MKAARTDRLIAPAVVALGLGLALVLGFAVSLHPTAALVVAIAAFVGIASFVMSAGWFATCSLIFATFCAVLVPVHVLEGVEFASLTPRPLLTFVFVALAVLTFMRHGPGLILRGGRTMMFAATLGLILLVVSLLYGTTNLEVIGSHWAIWVSAFVLALAVPPRLVRVVLISWIILAFFEAAYAIYETYFDPGLFFGPGHTRELYRWVDYTVAGFVRARGTLGHHISLALFLVTSFALALWAVRFPAGKRLRLLRWAILAVLALGTVATFSRSGWITLGVVVVAGLVLYYRRQWHGLGAFLICGALVALVFYTLLATETSEFAKKTENTISYQQRTTSMQTVPDLLMKRPLAALVGLGGNAQQEVYNAGILRYVRPDTPVIDNMYVTLVLQAGLLGLGVFGAMLWSAFRVARERASVVSSDLAISKTSISGIGIALFALLCMCFFIDGLYWPSTAAMFWAMMGFVSRQDERAQLDRTLR